MTTFPSNRVAAQQQAQVFSDAACRSLASLQVAGVPVPKSIIVADPVSGLWPVFTATETVLYYRTPSGAVVSFTPADLSSTALDLTTPRPIQGVADDPQSLIDLIAALAAIGLPVSYVEPE